MKIGVCVQFDSMETIESRLRDLRAEGFDNCQLISWKTTIWTPENLEILKALLSKYEVTVSAFWCGVEGPAVWNFYDGPKTLGLVPPEYREMRIGNLCSGADFAHGLGVCNVVTHMGFIPENMSDPSYPGVVAAVKAIAQELKRNDQNLLFETGQETPVVLLRLFEEVNTGNLYVNLDPANLILYGKANPIDALDVLGDYVRGVHAKDGMYPTNGRELGVEKKVGEGKVNFPAFLKALKERGYDGSLTIEREITGEQQLIDIRETQGYLKALIAQLG